MPTVTVTHADKSKSDKDRVYFDGKHNWQDAFYVSQKILAPTVGSVIDATTVSKDFNGKTTWFLNAWKPAQNVAPQVATARQELAGAQERLGWDIPTGDLSRLVSNIIGSAIAAHLIEDASDIASWTKAAYKAAESLRSGVFETAEEYENEQPPPGDAPGEPEFDDDIPF